MADSNVTDNLELAVTTALQASSQAVNSLKETNAILAQQVVEANKRATVVATTNQNTAGSSTQNSTLFLNSPNPGQQVPLSVTNQGDNQGDKKSTTTTNGVTNPGTTTITTNFDRCSPWGYQFQNLRVENCIPKADLYCMTNYNVGELLVSVSFDSSMFYNDPTKKFICVNGVTRFNFDTYALEGYKNLQAAASANGQTTWTELDPTGLLSRIYNTTDVATKVGLEGAIVALGMAIAGYDPQQSLVANQCFDCSTGDGGGKGGKKTFQPEGCKTLNEVANRLIDLFAPDGSRLMIETNSTPIADEIIVKSFISVGESSVIASIENQAKTFIQNDPITGGFSGLYDQQVFSNSTSTKVGTPGQYEVYPDNPCYLAQRRTDVTTNVKYVIYNSVNNSGCNPISISYQETISEEKWLLDNKISNPSSKTRKGWGSPRTITSEDGDCGCNEYNLREVLVGCGNDDITEVSDQIWVTIPGITPDRLKGLDWDPNLPKMTVRADCKETSIGIYQPLIKGRDIIENRVTSNTRGLFNFSQSMSCYLTSSLQSLASKDYYYEVTDCDCKSTPYFAVTYGNISGSGSLNSLGETNNDTPTRAIYSQYRLLALDEPERKFKYYDSGTEMESAHIYVINFNRNGLSDRVDPGNFEIPLIPLSGSAFANNLHTGSNVKPSGSTVYTFIDNSDDKSELSSCSQDPYVYYDIVSGSLVNGIHSSGFGDTKTTYGRFYPNLGVIVFAAEQMNSLLKFNTVTGSNIAGDNSMKLFTSISGSGVLGSFIKARNVKYKTTNHYFVRVSPPNSNYSNNPTYVIDQSTGKILNDCFLREPVTYVTSVGLYDKDYQLLAVAKLSKPIKKTPDDDLLIKIRLNW